MVRRARGLSAADVEALVRRDLEAEPGVTLRALAGGLGVLCHPPFGAARVDCLFAITAEGGMLLRLHPESLERAVEAGTAQANAALPGWVEAAVPDAEACGRPEEWAWVPVKDSAAYERRRPHLLEALEHCRHIVMVQRGSQDDRDTADRHRR